MFDILKLSLKIKNEEKLIFAKDSQFKNILSIFIPILNFVFILSKTNSLRLIQSAKAELISEIFINEVLSLLLTLKSNFSNLVHP